jgi:hypothetical protein
LSRRGGRSPNGRRRGGTGSRRAGGDASRRLGELTEQELTLPEDALTDSEAAAELANVRSEITACRETLENVKLARKDRERRKMEAIAAEKEAVLAAADREIRQLESQKRRLQGELDEEAPVVDLAKLRELDRLMSHQEAILRRVGRRGEADAIRPRPWQWELGFAWAMSKADCHSGMIRLGVFEAAAHVSRNRARPWSEVFPRIIEPAEESE